LQCAAVCCSVLQCVAVCFSVLQCVAVCCSVLQCVAVCCSVSQCVAVCCSVLQCIAVIHIWSLFCILTYGVATISRLLKIIGLFCKRAQWKRLYSAKETNTFKEPTNRSHPICIHSTVLRVAVCCSGNVDIVRWVSPIYICMYTYICIHIYIYM